MILQVDKGMNNRAQDHELPEGFARNMVNMDSDNRRRKGFVKVLTALNPRNAYNSPLGTYFVESGTLKKFNGSSAATILWSGITGTECGWEYFNGTVYFSDGTIGLKITSSGVTRWGMDIPGSPVLMPVSGSLGGGQYLGAVTFVDSNGVESGASNVVSVDANDSTSIKFINLPSSSDAQVDYLRLYLTAPNGKTFYQVGTVAIGTTNYTVTSVGSGKILETEFLSKPPAGRLLAFRDGRMYIATSEGIFYTEINQLDHVNLADNYIQTTVPATVLLPTPLGMFVVERMTYFFTGHHFDFNQKEILPYGALYGTGKKLKNSENVTWYSERGVVMGSPTGEVENIQEDNVAAHNGDSGSTLIREQDGVRQIVVSVKNPVTSPLGASSFSTAEIIRKS